MLTYAIRLPPGPNTVAYAVAAEHLGFERVWCPDIPAFGHDIWVTLARIAEQTAHIGIGAAVLVPSFRHPLAQASAIATLEALAPGRLWAGFGTGLTGRAGLGQPALPLAHMRQYILQVRGLLRGEAVEINGKMVQILASDGWLPARPITVPLLLASQGPRGRQLAHEIADGLITLGTPAAGFNPCLVSLNGAVLDDGEDVSSPRARAVLAPLVAAAYHYTYSRSPERVKSLPNGAAWLESVQKVPAPVRHLSVHRGHILDISNGHDELIDVSIARHFTFTGTRDELRKRLDALEAAGATGVIFGTSGVDIEREMRAFAGLAGL